MTGTIVCVKEGKGYGFIKSAGAPDTFFHAKALTDGLIFGEHLMDQQVQFDIVEADGRTRADLVRPVNI